MATFVNTSPSFGPRFNVSRVTGFISAKYEALQETMAAAQEARKAYNELSRLSNRELADIGMTRGDIARVAYQK